MENFELAALIEMCRLAEISMDDAFGSHHKVSAQVDAGGQTAIDPELEQRVAKLEADNQAIKPLVQIVDGFAALIASHMAVAQSQVNNGPPEAASLKTTGIIDAIEQEHEATGGVLPRARDFEQDQAKEKA